MSIVVTAASGHLGRLVVRDVLRRGIAPDHVVAGARSLPAVKDLADTGVRTVVLDYDQPDTVEAAINGVCRRSQRCTIGDPIQALRSAAS